MGVPIPVTQFAVKVSGTATRPYLLIADSTSTSTIYIGQSSAVTLDNYSLKLDPGSSITWTDINSEVWAVTATGGSGKVTVAYEASGTFTPIQQGANPVLLKTLSIPFTTGSTTITGNVADFAISSYNSLTVMLSVTLTTALATPNGNSSNPNSLVLGYNPSANVIPNTANAFINLAGVQYEAAYAGQSATFAKTNSALFSFGDGVGNVTGLQPAIQTYQFSVTNQMFALYVNAYKRASIAVAGTINIRIYGSQAQVNGTIYTNQPDPTAVLTWTPGGTGLVVPATLNVSVDSNPAAGLMFGETITNYTSGTWTGGTNYFTANLATKQNAGLTWSGGAAAANGNAIVQATYLTATTLAFARFDSFPTLTTNAAGSAPLMLTSVINLTGGTAPAITITAAG